MGFLKSFSFISDEPSKKIKKLARSWDDCKNLAAEKQAQHVYQKWQAGDKVKTEKMDHDSQSVKREVK